MRYLADIIPSDAKVLPDYFKGEPQCIKPLTKKAKFISRIMAAIFFLFALYFFSHPLLLLIFMIMGLGLLPSIHVWLEKKLHFEYSSAIKRLIYGVMVVPLLLLTAYYHRLDAQIAHELFLKNQEIKREQAIAIAKDSIRRDSLSAYLSLLQHQRKDGKLSINEANSLLEKSMLLATSKDEKKQVAYIKFDIDKESALKLVKQAKYKAALESISDLLTAFPEDVTLRYNRAICYDKLGKTEDAVRDLRQAMETGNKEAEKYHNKINPLRKRVVGYVTRCCDGTTSSATGRGACSWHGGVCNWNDPIYET
ncbi:MAG TPA: hypothetical protein VFS25_16930 [Chitinophaga sp.]|uniref:hypothetical protein n=1 Tax=Chitinophaga sp. TaxID=1869181 RepID=UPI002DBF0AD1|nr:hypothetical protein [Chitinophaga sp.]HEU4554534.1 hypothetical protein [Chitinophaga sp.]